MAGKPDWQRPLRHRSFRMRRRHRDLNIYKNTTIILVFGLTVGVLRIAALADAFLQPPQYVGPPMESRALNTRAFQGISSLAVTPGGRLWATWYAGPTPGEDKNNYVVLATSGDDGTVWNEYLVVDPDGAGDVRAFDPEIWLAPNGHLYLFWAQAIDHTATIGGVWTLEFPDPEHAEPAWLPPRRLTDGVMMCKPLVLSSGEWALPASTWRLTDNSARMIVSTDQGASWSLRGAAHVPVSVRSFDEHMLVEQGDGSLWMLVRTSYGIGESFSTDRGVTWNEVAPAAIQHPSARFFIRRLASGNLLLVKHGPIEVRTARSHLTAFISTDDGANWSGGLLLDERTGVSYPDGQQTADGTIYITYDYSRTNARQIYMAVFTEADAAAGQPISEATRLRQIISSYAPESVTGNRTGALLEQPPDWGALASDNATVVPLELGTQIFSDRDYTFQELPSALEDTPPMRHRARFLRVAMENSATLNCTRAGMIYFMTPSKSRNPNASQAETLISQGFKRARLPEVRVFGANATAGFCTIYQKRCDADEIVNTGSWAIPFFFQH
jgi:hypothetical protein